MGWAAVGLGGPEGLLQLISPCDRVLEIPASSGKEVGAFHFSVLKGPHLLRRIVQICRRNLRARWVPARNSSKAKPRPLPAAVPARQRCTSVAALQGYLEWLPWGMLRNSKRGIRNWEKKNKTQNFFFGALDLFLRFSSPCFVLCSIFIFSSLSHGHGKC